MDENPEPFVRRRIVELLVLLHLFALILVAGYGLLVAHNLTVGSAAYWGAWVAYSCVVYGASCRVAWCLKISIFPPLLLFLGTAPIVLVNMLAFIGGHELFQDSPATILIVAIMAIVLTLPAACMLAIYWIFRQEVFDFK